MKVIPTQQFPDQFLQIVREYVPDSDGHYIAQLLWQRGIRQPNQLAGFLDPDAYKPTSPFAFGQEMKWAIKRLQQAWEGGEKVAIWGDFDADGITATSVLWEGLGQFFSQHQQLTYTIPNRLRESHGFNESGIERLAAAGTKLIVTCDTGSTNLKEIDFANQLGIDIIITDHHSLPEERPSVVSIINPRYFAETHPLFYLSGVAVAYKLVEALYQTFPSLPQQPLENLLDLVAIGLIADLVELKGDCRYLAQKGIQRLQKQLTNPTRPGVARLLKLCQRTGDRPTDISFGLGPRINAVSRIHGEASFCVELLTSQDKKQCDKLAIETELANNRRKALQKDIVKQVKKKLAQIDLSTTHVIVLEDPQWQSGVLGLVAGQIAQEYGRPTILLTTAEEKATILGQDKQETEKISLPLARGSARSVNNIDLYQLVKSQEHLLERFGGHPFAAGLSLPVENIPLFREAINQQLRQQCPEITALSTEIEADLVVTVSELGKSLFRELKLLEPCGMGNPVPKLLIKNCWFVNISNKNIQDLPNAKGKKVQYIKTSFEICDKSVKKGFSGVWWGHYQEELPQNQLCNAIIELDFNTHQNRYEARLIAVQSLDELTETEPGSYFTEEPYLLDYRNQVDWEGDASSRLLLKKCPHNWSELEQEYRLAISHQEKLALAYPPPPKVSPQETWKQLVGIAKYLSRTHKIISREQLKETLGFSESLLQLGLQTLSALGFNHVGQNQGIQLTHSAAISSNALPEIQKFLQAVAEEQFQRQYFYQVPLSFLQQRLQGLSES